MMQHVALTTPDRPTQAVILAGGRGTRLRPITDTRPKAMVEIHGKPFLEYLVEQLRDQGFRRILLLLGYLPQVIQDHFGDGRRWGVDISYSITAPDDETGWRVKHAEPLLDSCFLLMYCDNYWPLQMDRMWPRFVAANVPAMITVYSNLDEYTRNSVRVDPDGFVADYDKSCTHADLQGVEISYAILRKSVIEEYLTGENVLFETTVYPPLAARRQLLAYVSDHRYYSVGSLRRLPLTETFLARQPAVILDRDGVLNQRPPRAQYVRNWSEFRWLPGVHESLRLFNQAGYRVIVVSNQAGIARGAMTEDDLETIHQRLRAEAVEAGGRVDAFYYCPHDWDAGCPCRKPKPGMLFQAQRDFQLDLSRTTFVGDDERDAQAADAAGCPAALVTPQRGLLEITRELLNGGSATHA
jgi:histidinol-phosphate phosphatase family protein